MAEVRETLRESVLRGTFAGGIIFAVIFALVFGFTGISLFGLAGIFGIIAGAFLGLFIGAVVGLVFSLMPPKLANFVITILVVAAIIYLGVLVYAWNRAGVFGVFFSPLGVDLERAKAGIAKGARCVYDPVECFFKPFYDWSEPTVVENKEEEISVKVDFSRLNSVFKEGEDITATAALLVKNPTSEPLILQPKCFLDDKEMELEETAKVQGGAVEFRSSEGEQSASIVCKTRGIRLSGDKEIEQHTFKVKIVRPVIARAEWNVYVLPERVLEQKEDAGEDPFLSIQEENLRGKTVLSKMLFDAPLKLVIGSDDDQPFTEGNWLFSIILSKRDVKGKVTALESINLEVPPGEVRIASPCPDFQGTFSDYSVPSNKLRSAEEVLAREDSTQTQFICSLAVNVKDIDRKVPQKTIVKTTAKFDFEEIHEAQITIFKQGNQ